MPMLAPIARQGRWAVDPVRDERADHRADDRSIAPAADGGPIPWDEHAALLTWGWPPRPPESDRVDGED